MKKTFRIIGMAMMAVLLSVSLAACGGDNEEDLDDPDDPGTDQPVVSGDYDKNLVGTWATQYAPEYTDFEIYHQITFKSNGQYEVNMKTVGAGQYDQKMWQKGTWTADGKYLYIVEKECSEPDYELEEYTMKYSVSKNTLTLYTDDSDKRTFQRKK